MSTPIALWLAEKLEDPESSHGYRLVANNAANELRRLHQFELAFTKYLEKTEWVQETAKPHELGMDRADVLKQRIDRLYEVNQMLLDALKEARNCVEDWGHCANQYEQIKYGLKSDLLLLDAAIKKAGEA